jgi:hypothetical protein
MSDSHFNYETCDSRALLEHVDRITTGYASFAHALEDIDDLSLIALIRACERLGHNSPAVTLLQASLHIEWATRQIAADVATPTVNPGLYDDYNDTQLPTVLAALDLYLARRETLPAIDPDTGLIPATAAHIALASGLLAAQKRALTIPVRADDPVVRVLYGNALTHHICTRANTDAVLHEIAALTPHDATLLGEHLADLQPVKGKTTPADVRRILNAIHTQAATEHTADPRT